MPAKTRRKRAPKLHASEWVNLPDEELLQLRVRDLGLTIQGSAIEPYVEQLYGELDTKSIHFKPPCYLADEWFCPDREPIIGVPFCLAHPRLKQLEQRRMFDVEGGTPESCMKFLRHECGHAVNYAYELYRRTRWRELFGPFSEPYKTSYRSRPYSKRYVVHLEDNYAQAHPDEDFAETFAVWLTPGEAWRERYKNWPVMRKLFYIDRLMRTICVQPALVTEHSRPWSAERMISTLEAYYIRKQKELGQDFQGYYDDYLKRLFAAGSDANGKEPTAAQLLRRHRRHLTTCVAAWTAHRKYDVHTLITKLAKRCDVLGLRLKTDELGTLMEVSTLLTTLAQRLLEPISREGRR